MRHAYAHDAVLDLAPDADMNAPGAAITTALCGHWEHEPPCPLAPHHTGARRDGPNVCLRILFATEPDREAEVRQRIGRALTAWDVRSCAAGSVRPDEQAHVGRLAGSPS
ncbi:MAG: hypothetical protein H0X35_02405 [Pseudonocardiales bacterium]|nr:hypothetical protein [Pseudonocardiales bacterium]